MTRDFAKLSISPESSDGFASVGTILPKEEATLLPGGLFAFLVRLLCDCGTNFPKRKPMKKNYFDREFDLEDEAQWRRCRELGEVRSAPKKEALHVSCSASCVADINRSFVTRYIDMADLCRRRGSRRK